MTRSICGYLGIAETNLLSHAITSLATSAIQKVVLNSANDAEVGDE